MKRFQKKFRLLLLLAVGALALQTQAYSKAVKVVVVVKADGALAGLNLKDIRAIYLGEKVFQDSTKIEPLVNAGESVATVFFKKVLDKNKAQYKKIWKTKAFVDGLVAPSEIADSIDILKTVEKSDAAIGFVDDQTLTAADKKTLKVLFSADSADKQE